jgi:hypothetical protein
MSRTPIVLVLVVSLVAMIVPSTAYAQTWPTSWILIDSNGNENGWQDDYRDVHTAHYSLDSEYIYLRLCCFGTPYFTSPPETEVKVRYKWLIDTGIGSNLYTADTNIIRGAEFILFVEDSDPRNDGIGEVYLLDAHGDDTFAEYETPADRYKDAPPYGPVTDPTIAGYRIDGNCIDLYVKISALGRSDPYGVNVWWATCQENQNLEQGPTTDTADIGDMPFEIPYPPSTPVLPDIYIGITAAFGTALLGYMLRRRLIHPQ